jgi:hypothetical protein
MADKDLESDDPYEFVAVRFPLPPGVDGDEECARTFIEEYALLGVPRNRILRIFASPHFAGAHAISQKRGEEFLRAIVDDVYGPATQEV